MLVINRFPTHVAKTNNKVKENKYIKINNQSIYNGAINRFTRNTVINNIHSRLENELKDQDLPNIDYPVQLVIKIYTVINHGDVARRSGKIAWNKPPNDYMPSWDEDNLRMIWEKCIKDVLSKLKVWPDDNSYYCRGTNSMVYFVEELNERKIEIDFIKL